MQEIRMDLDSEMSRQVKSKRCGEEEKSDRENPACQKRAKPPEEPTGVTSL